MCSLRNIALESVTESVTDGQTGRRTDGRTERHMDRQTDDGQSDPYVPLCFAGNTKTEILTETSSRLSDELIIDSFSNDFVFFNSFTTS